MKIEADMIQANWSGHWRPHWPCEAEIKRAALLAWEGYLTSVENLGIQNLSITDIPRDQMEKLASIVTGAVNINNMTHTDQLGSILASVKGYQLGMYKMDLSDTETQALVTAMRDGVQRVGLVDVTLDIEELTQYDGQGSCSGLAVCDDSRIRYRERLRRWAADKGWRVTRDTDSVLVICKSGN